jgi:hypothetical protein
MTEQEVREVKRKHSAWFLGRPGVSGVGVEKTPDGRFVLAVHVDPAHPSVRDGLPQEVEGVPVTVVESGPFRKL